MNREYELKKNKFLFFLIQNEHSRFSFWSKMLSVFCFFFHSSLWPDAESFETRHVHLAAMMFSPWQKPCVSFSFCRVTIFWKSAEKHFLLESFLQEFPLFHSFIHSLFKSFGMCFILWFTLLSLISFFFHFSTASFFPVSASHS